MVTAYIRSRKKNASNTQIDKTICKRLRKADRLFNVPFEVILNDHPSSLMCDEIIRVLPGKRMVVFGQWEGKAVVAKIFYGRQKAQRNFQEDIEGVEILKQQGIPTPLILHKGSLQDKRVRIIIFERILESQNLFDIWQKRHNIDEVKSLMHAVTLELATQHVLGVIQKDLHLKNFLVSKKQIYTLDGGSVSQYGTILPKEESLTYLALFFSQLGIDSGDLQDYLFEVYSKARGWIVRPADILFLKKTVKHWNKTRWMRFRKKIFRSCTAYSRKQTSRKLVIFDRSYQTADFLALLLDPEKYFTDGNAEILKKGQSSTVIGVNIDNRDLVIKRYNLKNTWHRLRRCVRSTRAARSWCLANQLLMAGINTAKPIAFIENRYFGFRGVSYYIMENIKGPNLLTYFTQQSVHPQALEMANKVIGLLSNLAKLNLTHGDLKATNILVENEKPFLIDLDGMEFHLTWFGLKRAWKQEIKRFLRNWDRFPTVKSLFERISIL